MGRILITSFLLAVPLALIYHVESTSGKKSWVDDGCAARGIFRTGSFQPQSYKASVRCCSNDGKSCTTPLHCPNNKMSYAEAVSKCSNEGRRICTKDELNSGVCCGTGGNCDSYEVWTSEVSEGASGKASALGNGYCRYGSNKWSRIGGKRTITLPKCKQSCQTTSGCTAYAFNRVNGLCDMYRGGPYTYANGSKRVQCYALSGGKEIGEKDCVMWRQTGGCSPYGRREPRNDKDCSVKIKNGWSGYCECGNGRKTMRVGCRGRRTTNCYDACKA